MTRLTVITLLFLFVACKQQPINIWLAGDSTLAWKKPSRSPESGWGEGLKLYVNENTMVHNHAASGRSSKSFIDEGRWQNMVDSLKKGDYVIIQFGHNDEKTKEKLHTTPYGTFKENLKKFIEESKQKGANPIVCSSIVRRQFNPDGTLKDTHGDYIAAAEEIAKETKILYVDMESLTHELVTEMGPDKSKEIYNYTSRKQDSTHLNVKGAARVAELFVKEIKAQHLPLSAYLNNK